MLIHPASDARVATAEQGNAIFHGAKCGAGEVLPLRRLLAKPTVVGEVHHEICFAIHMIADVMREGIFKADERRSFHFADLELIDAFS